MSAHNCAGWDSCPNPEHRPMTLTDFLLARIAEGEAAATDFEFASLSGDGYLPKSVSPARVLADCEAKRQIVEAYDSHLEAGAWAQAAGLMDALMFLALPYADHPDYREGWRP